MSTRPVISDQGDLVISDQGRTTYPGRTDVRRCLDMTQSASRPFQAQYQGACGRCFESIEVGDLVRYVADVLVHHHHLSSSPRPERICDRCHLVTPCECDA